MAVALCAPRIDRVARMEPATAHRDAMTPGWKGGFSSSWISPRPRAMLSGMVPCWLRPWATFQATHVWRVLRRRGIQLQRRRSWCVSTDPEFVPKAADIVVVYLDPPDNALVLSVDEKPYIQALERAQGYLKVPEAGRCVASAMITSGMELRPCLPLWM